MTRHILTPEERAKGLSIRTESYEARKLRREAELALLNRLYAEAAMREWYPHQ